jgi:hypothetical protein
MGGRGERALGERGGWSLARGRGRAGRVVPAASPDRDVFTFIIIIVELVATVPSGPPLNATWALRGGAQGRFGTRTSPERPRFQGFLEPVAKSARTINNVKCATYVKAEAVRRAYLPFWRGQFAGGGASASQGPKLRPVRELARPNTGPKPVDATVTAVSRRGR